MIPIVTIPQFVDAVNNGVTMVEILRNKERGKKDYYDFVVNECNKLCMEDNKQLYEPRIMILLERLPKYKIAYESMESSYYLDGMDMEVEAVYREIALLRPIRADIWAWNFPLQLWYHQSCMSFVIDEDNNNEGFCPICGKPTPHSMTVEDLERRIFKYRFPDEDYFGYGVFLKDSHDDLYRMQIWKKGISWISVYMVPGGSEGYYVHVDWIYNMGSCERFLLGKFWNPVSAMDAVSRITGWIYGIKGI